MKVPEFEEEKQMVQYLLDELSDEGRLAVQQRLFRDEEFYERLRSVEDDLIDSCARGELAQDEARKVERFLMSASQFERLRFAKTLAQTAATVPGVSKSGGDSAVSLLRRVRSTVAQLFSGWPARRAILVAASLGLVVTCSWLFLENRRLQSRIDTAQLQPLPRAEQFSGPSETFSFFVSPGVLRNAQEMKRVRIPSQTKLVELQLELERSLPYDRYAVELKTTSGDSVWNQSGRPPSDTTAGKLSLWIPAGVLQRGNYEATLSGIASSGVQEIIYYFYFGID